MNEPYRPERYRTREAVARLAQDLAARFQCGVVLTGIGFSRSKPAPPVWSGPGDEPAFLRFLKKSPDIITVPATCSPVSLWPPK